MLGLHCYTGFSLVVVNGGYSLAVMCRLLIAVASLVGSMGSGVWSVQAQQLWPESLAALRHVGSSQTKDQTCVPCIGRQILNHWTRDVPTYIFNIKRERVLFPWWM